MSKHFILATAGHVDHGKSSLVKALTGTDPDRLPEEKARGITIDLGFACLDLFAIGKPDSSFRLGIVDVPGHEDFVKNMVAGVGSVDVALLAVAADDGWMPQTEEHLQILSYLGVTRMVVALTKIDLPAVSHESVRESIRQTLHDTPFAAAPIVPVSAATHSGIEELKSALISVLATTPPPRDLGKPRLAVDRAFTLRGIGTVVTGTLTGGALNIGQAIIVQPSGQLARIRSIQSHNENLVSIGPGTRTALNLADVAVNEQAAAGTSHEGVRRGDVVTLPEFGQPVSTLEVILTRSTRLREGMPRMVRPLKDGARLRIYHGSGNWSARLRLCERGELAPGESAIAQLCFEGPIFAFVNDRFIVRDWSEQTTLAGGVVLADDGDPKRFHDPVRQQFLGEDHSAAVGDPNARFAAQLNYAGLVQRSNFLVKSGFGAAEIETVLNRLAGEGRALMAGGLIADPQWWEALCQCAIETIDAAHRTDPGRVGMPISQLRAALEDRLQFPDAFEALMADLSKRGFVQAGTTIKRKTHRPELPPQLQATGARLRASLALKPMEPPSRAELTPDSQSQQALRFLIETQEVIELGPETVITRKAFASASEIIQKFLITHRSATVSELRQAVGTSRRIIVPLLEKLDRNGSTLRQGDRRVLRA